VLNEINGSGVYDGLSVMLSQIVTWGLPYFIGRVYFDDLTMVTGDHDIKPGDSGALVISEERTAVAMVIGRSLDGRTTDNPSQPLGPIGILCDLSKIQTALLNLVGSPLTLA